MNTAVNVMFGVVSLWVVGVFLAGGLICIPANKFWDQSIDGTCLNPYKVYYGQQIPNILTDVILLIMPIHVVWSLHISRYQKMLLCGVFLVGGLYVSLITLVPLNSELTGSQNLGIFNCPIAGHDSNG